MPKSATTNSGTGAGLIVAVVVTLVVAGFGGYMLGNRVGQSSAKLEENAVAVVNNEKITQLDLYNRLISKGGAETVEQMIDEVLVNQAAAEAGVKVSAAEVDAELNKIKERFGGEAGFAEALAQYNVKVEDLKQDLNMRLIMTQIVTKDLPMDDNTLQTYFTTNMAKFDKRELTSRHILVETKEESDAIKAQLDGGADFAALAKEHSTEPGAAESGGDLGVHVRGKMVPEFDEVAFNLKEGEISDPFETEFGWHIAQVLDVKGEAPTYASMAAEVKAAYLDERAQDLIPAWLAEQREAASIKNHLKTEE